MKGFIHSRLSLLTKALIALALTGVFQLAAAQEFVWAPDFPVGASLPEISAQDQDGKLRTFDDLKGETGMLFMLSRSFDWWPYCKSQLVQLTDVAEQFEALGFSIAAISYDSVELLKEVQEDQEIEFPLLHDENVKHVNALGIRNLDYEPGHRVYGIPYPGIFLVDSNGVIKHKFAEERYQDRPNFEGVLEAAASM